MSDALGPQQLGQKHGEVVPRPRRRATRPNYSDEVAGAHRRRGPRAASTTPTTRPGRSSRCTASTLDRLADALVENETLDDARARRDLRRRSPPWPGTPRRPTAAGARPRRAGAGRGADRGRSRPRRRRRRSRPVPSAADGTPSAPDRRTGLTRRRRPSIDHAAHREGRPRDPRAPSARTPTATGCCDTPGAGRPHVRRDLRRAARGPGRAPARSPSRPTTTRWSWCATSRSTRCASTTSCRSSARPTWPTSRTRTAASPACRSWPAWSTATPSGPQVQERLTTQIADDDRADAAAPGRAGRHRGRAPVHVDAGRPQAGRHHRHLGGAGPVPRRTPPPAPRPCASSAAASRPERAGSARAEPTGTPDSARAPLVMGVLNVTPDSFSDGGRWLDRDAAVAHGLRAGRRGRRRGRRRAASRPGPGAEPVDEAEELRRVVPVVEALAAARAGSRSTPARPRWPRPPSPPGPRWSTTCRRRCGEVAAAGSASAGSPCTCRASPRTMQADPRYDDVVAEVRDFLVERAERGRGRRASTRSGSTRASASARRPTHNLALLRHLDALVATGLPGARRHQPQGVPRRAAAVRRRRRPTAGRRPARGLAGHRRRGPMASGARMVRVHDVRRHGPATPSRRCRRGRA